MRTNTELEEKLIKGGFRLESKTYIGKKSEKTHSYIYKAEIERTPMQAMVQLNAKRTKIISWGISNMSIENYGYKTHYECAEYLKILEEALNQLGIDLDWDYEPW